jgi:uncharacterized protein (DUF2249 family)
MHTTAYDAGTRPAALAAIADDDVIMLDVRDELRAKREPFSQIMAALEGRPQGGALAVRAIFDPVPLYGVMRSHGLSSWTEQGADDDWTVWFFEDTPGDTAEESAVMAAPAPDADGDTVVIDVRGLEPPEPMVRTLAALESLPAGATLVQINGRVPQFLLPLLEERGFTYEVREQDEELVRLFIRHHDQGSN